MLLPDQIDPHEQLCVNLLATEVKVDSKGEFRNPGNWFIPPNKYPKLKSVNRFGYSSIQCELLIATKRGKSMHKVSEGKLLAITSCNNLNSAWMEAISLLETSDIYNRLHVIYSPIKHCGEEKMCFCLNASSIEDLEAIIERNDCNIFHADIVFPIKKPKDLSSPDTNQCSELDARQLFITFIKQMGVKDKDSGLYLRFVVSFF